MAARYLATTRSGSPISTHAAVVQPERAVADGLHVGHRVRDEQNGDAARAQLVHLAHAALAEINVAHGQGFIHQQDFRIHVDGHGERQPHHHAARVSLDRLVDELADFGEGFDFAVALVDLPRGQAQDGAVQVHVVAPAELRIEAGAQLEQRRDAAVDGRRPAVGCRMPATICSRVLLPEPFSPTMQKVSPRRHLEADVVQRPEIPVALQAVEGQQFLEPVARRSVDRVALGNPLKLDGVHGTEERPV